MLFSLAAYALAHRVYNQTESLTVRIIVTVIAVGQPLAYLKVALTDPGVIISQPACTNIEHTKYCKDCHFNVEKSTYHCKLCDVCIEEYDHHCPWVSKCIGRGNLRSFYVFLFMTPMLLGALMISYAASAK